VIYGQFAFAAVDVSVGVQFPVVEESRHADHATRVVFLNTVCGIDAHLIDYMPNVAKWGVILKRHVLTPDWLGASHNGCYPDLPTFSNGMSCQRKFCSLSFNARVFR
jgi:hypothetical protein